ncbi:hypothetical protein [Natronobeatus ordinarius]|uniref:hypothetical protein n=1 Tax=Natronobeatus ordinarius TaxID=2963433 RepID=UPI0020CBFDF7|nr:hypothetical protein [Natronobeatus ordinarius]
MSADDLSEEEVISQFQNIVDINTAYLERKNQYKSEILSDEDQSELIRARLEEGIDRDKKHDNLLKQTISAFLPGGPIESKTGWTFLGAEPLSEKNLANADALFGNPERNLALLIECKTSDNRPTNSLEQVYDAAEQLMENKGYLSNKIGMEIDDIECAICIPSVADRRIINEIETHEREGRDRERIYVWRIHYYDGETLDLYTDIDTRTGSELTHNSELASVLKAGVELTYGRQVMPAFFPSSHPEVIMEEAMGLILEKRLIEDNSLRYFTGSELQRVLSSQKNLPHYDADDIGKRLYDDLVDRCERFNLIEEIPQSESKLEKGEDETYYKYCVRGKSVETILNNLRDRYIENAVKHRADIMAKRSVIDEFDKEQSSLDQF